MSSSSRDNRSKMPLRQYMYAINEKYWDEMCDLGFLKAWSDLPDNNLQNGSTSLDSNSNAQVSEQPNQINIEIPTELLEKIASYFDGKTLLNFRLASKRCKDIVFNLQRYYQPWQKVCRREIPRLYFIDIISERLCNSTKLNPKLSQKQYEMVYRIWNQWQCMDFNVECVSSRNMSEVGIVKRMNNIGLGFENSFFESITYKVNIYKTENNRMKIHNTCTSKYFDKEAWLESKYESATAIYIYTNVLFIGTQNGYVIAYRLQCWDDIVNLKKNNKLFEIQLDIGLICTMQLYYETIDKILIVTSPSHLNWIKIN